MRRLRLKLSILSEHGLPVVQVWHRFGTGTLEPGLLASFQEISVFQPPGWSVVLAPSTAHAHLVHSFPSSVLFCLSEL